MYLLVFHWSSRVVSVDALRASLVGVGARKVLGVRLWATGFLSRRRSFMPAVGQQTRTARSSRPARAVFPAVGQRAIGRFRSTASWFHSGQWPAPSLRPGFSSLLRRRQRRTDRFLVVKAAAAFVGGGRLVSVSQRHVCHPLCGTTTRYRRGVFSVRAAAWPRFVELRWRCRWRSSTRSPACYEKATGVVPPLSAVPRLCTSCLGRRPPGLVAAVCVVVQVVAVGVDQFDGHLAGDSAVGA